VVRLKLATLYDEVLNDPVAALYHYNIYLTLAPSSPDAPAVEGYRLMARAKLLRDLKRESLPKPPSDTFDEQIQLVKALKAENNRLARTLRETDQRYNALRQRMSAPPRKIQTVKAPPPAEELYTVRSGDTLSGIAHSRGVSLRNLMQANGLNASSLLRSGQVLRILR
jgi:LysM repeat protein